MRAAVIGALVLTMVSLGACGPRSAMRATCKVVAKPASHLENKFLESARAFAVDYGYALVVLDGRWDPIAVTATLGAKPVLRLIKRPGGSGAYSAFFYAGGDADSDTRVRSDAVRFAEQEGRTAAFNIKPMKSDETPPLDTEESACVARAA